MKYKWGALLICAIVFISCNEKKEISDFANSSKSDNRLSDNEIVEILDGFDNKSKTRSKESSVYSLTKSYTVECLNSKTKSINEIFISEYKIEDSNNEGYAIVINDNRFPHVLAYVPNGSITDTAFIAPLNTYIKSIPSIVSTLYEELDNQTLVRPEMRLGGAYAINEIKTKWHDDAPYNAKIPVKCSGQPTFAGSHTAAIAQVCAHFKRGSYDWSTILSAPTIDYGQTGRIEAVSALYLDAGNAAKTEYTCNGSYTDAANVVNALKNLKFSGARIYPANDIAYIRRIIFEEINAGGLIIMGGVEFFNNKRQGSSYWIVDACTISVDMNYENNYSNGFCDLHCNWGLKDGRSNGYFAFLTNGSLLTTGVIGNDANSFRSITVIGGIKK